MQAVSNFNVRPVSVRPSVMSVSRFFPHKQCRFHGSPLFGSVFRSVKSLKHFAKCSSDFRDLKSGYFLDHLSKSKDLSDVGHVTQSLMV